MGVPANRIVKEKTPYVAKNVLKKYDEDTTAVVYIFGKKEEAALYEFAMGEKPAEFDLRTLQNAYRPAPAGAV